MARPNRKRSIRSLRLLLDLFRQIVDLTRDIYGSALKALQDMAKLPNGVAVTDFEKYFSAEAVQILKMVGAISIVRNGLDVTVTLDKAKEFVSENGNDKVFLKKVLSLRLPSATPTEVRLPDVKGISGQQSGWINWKLLALLLERMNAQRDRLTAKTDVTTISVVIDNETGKVVKQHRSRVKKTA